MTSAPKASGMVERVARAMWQSEWDRAQARAAVANKLAGRDVFVHAVPRWENCDLIFLDYARAAIAAMREPTEAMVEACDRAAFAQGGGAIVLRPVWDAMIDSALSEEVES